MKAEEYVRRVGFFTGLHAIEAYLTKSPIGTAGGALFGLCRRIVVLELNKYTFAKKKDTVGQIFEAIIKSLVATMTACAAINALGIQFSFRSALNSTSNVALVMFAIQILFQQK